LSAEKAIENGTFIDAAKRYGSAFAETDITESAIDMERVEVVFDL
jgi:hypothetical protein